MDISPFGNLTTPDAVGRRDVERVSLRSSALAVSVLSFGATLHTVEAPDGDGRAEAVCLALGTLADHENRSRNAYLGATCGRYANRIGGAAYEVDGHRVLLEPNDGTNQLHGGPDGFSRRIWDVLEAVATDDGGRVVLGLHSPHGDQGHPGSVDATATYEIHGHTLRITYGATTDRPTAVNLTNHAYWNLGGRGRWDDDGSIGDHELRVTAEMVLRAGPDLLPTGPLTHVQTAGLDLRHGPLLSDVFAGRRHGLDNSFQVTATAGPADGGPVTAAAELHHPRSGRTLTVSTDQPALHVYTANRLGAPFGVRSAVCLEAQRFPDAPNRPDLPGAILRPGEHYESTTELTFGIR